MCVIKFCNHHKRDRSYFLLEGFICFVFQSFNLNFMFIKVLAIKTKELNSVQSDCSARSCQMENKHAQELTTEREKALQVLI